MYIDFIKSNYSDVQDKRRNEYIERDKKILGNLIRERISNDIDQIVTRWYELEDIGCCLVEEKFLELLKEAESLFCFGYYTGTIAIIGIASEEVTKYVYAKNNSVKDNLTQDKRLRNLKKKNVINDTIFRSLNKIRIIRNDCTHYNDSFKKLDEVELYSNAKVVLLEYKKVLNDILEFNELDTIEITHKILNENQMTFEEFKYKYRNLIKEQEKLDLQIDPSINRLIFTSLYKVLEIDIDSDNFKEMTLYDLERELVAVVDLTLPQVDKIRRMNLVEGNIILATVISLVSQIGITEEWQLLDVKDVFKGKINV
ncbi:MAG: DUF4145 domain-containing protein [Clostridium sp.]